MPPDATSRRRLVALAAVAGLLVTGCDDADLDADTVPPADADDPADTIDPPQNED